MSIKNVSLKQIASELNVSINTVSRALRDMDDISHMLKIQVRQKAIELGYMPNRVAQTMRKDEKPVIAITIDSFHNLYFNTFINEFIKILQKNNEYDFLFFYVTEPKINLIKKCILQRCDLLITHTMLDSKTYAFAKLNNIHVIFVGYSFNNYDIDNVAVDNLKGCEIAASYLANSSNGYNYVYVGPNYFFSSVRYSMFKNELRQMDINAQVISFNIDKKEVKELYNLIENGYRNIFFYNDELVYSVRKKLKQIDPKFDDNFKDVRIIGFDGLCEHFDGLEQINTIKIDYLEYASNAYKVVENRLKNPKSNTQKINISVSLHEKKEN